MAWLESSSAPTGEMLRLKAANFNYADRVPLASDTHGQQSFKLKERVNGVKTSDP